jgi:hypothetical protein
VSGRRRRPMNKEEVRRCVETALVRVGSDRLSMIILTETTLVQWVAYFRVRRSPTSTTVEPLTLSISASATEQEVTDVVVQWIREILPK